MQKMDKGSEERAIKRLEENRPAFENEYEQLCKKYQMRIVPMLLPKEMANGNPNPFEFGISLRFDTYTPIDEEKLKQSMEKVKAEEATNTSS